MPRIPPARSDEPAAVAVLIDAINSQDGPPPTPPMTSEVVLRHLMGGGPRALPRVADLDGTPIAFANAAPLYDALRLADALFLLDLYSAPEYRRCGAARALLAELAAYAQATGAGCLFRGLDDGDDEALLFLRSIGSVSGGRFSGEILEDAALQALATRA